MRVTWVVEAFGVIAGLGGEGRKEVAAERVYIAKELKLSTTFT